ncbi:hypothetical protein [Microlunatus sp. Gsoil 973]|uniref:hypothetical protein n=1 Tax=Microlunatus sp. Gsoil 973 TaxID=2672569 RepID=UPI0012B4CC3E|nr:hypothetical protein [Microlunatus sp. Gsoil 973]QGN34051.1 hypothetical protein GJV80_15895 [Microlunatus sp. Gsoil 973]
MIEAGMIVAGRGRRLRIAADSDLDAREPDDHGPGRSQVRRSRKLGLPTMLWWMLCSVIIIPIVWPFCVRGAVRADARRVLLEKGSSRR